MESPWGRGGDGEGGGRKMSTEFGSGSALVCSHTARFKNKTGLLLWASAMGCCEGGFFFMVL